MKQEPLETRVRILDSVMKLILSGGVQAVTLSAVCEKSKLSKGGLVHYFPSKESLIDAFIQRAVREYLDLIESTLNPVDPGQGRRGSVFVKHFFNETQLSNDESNDDCVAVMVALVQGGRRGSTLSELFDNIFKQLRSDGVSAELATLILVSLDGLWFESVIEDRKVIAGRARQLRRCLLGLISSETELKGAQVKNKRTNQKSNPQPAN